MKKNSKNSVNNYENLFDGLNRGQNQFRMVITPEKAAEMLTWNNHNRPMYPSTYDNYARLMREDAWHDTGTPLVFDPRGLADGQHRLKAIVLSGKTYMFTIFVTSDEDIHMYLDSGLKRSNLDSLRQSLRNQTLKGKHISVLKAMFSGRFCFTQNHLTAMELKALFEKYGETVIFATDLLGIKTDATIIGVFARACLHLQSSFVLAFAEAWKKVDFAPIAQFQHFMTQLTDRKSATKREIYKRFYFTIQAFVNNSEMVEYPMCWNDEFTL